MRGTAVMRLAFFAFLLLLVGSCARPADLEVKDVWTRDTVGRTANAALFMTISSHTPDRLMSASTPVARKTDLMTMKAAGGAMQMTYLDGIDIPADTPVVLKAGGLHVWLAGLTKPLRAGQTFPLRLTFQKAGERQLVVRVLEPGA